MTAVKQVSFVFDDDSFFNCEVSAAHWRRMLNHHEQDGYFYIQNLADEMADRHKVNLKSHCVQQVIEGGCHPQDGSLLPLGVLYPCYQEYTQKEGSRQEIPEGKSSVSNEQDAVEQSQENTGQPSPCDRHDTSWSHAAVLLLLEKYRELRHLFPIKRKMEVWQKIAEKMTDFGYRFSAGVCMKKWDNLKIRYRIIKDRNKITGRGRATWAYLGLMEDLLHSNPSVSPMMQISSLSGEKGQCLLGRKSTNLESHREEPAPAPLQAAPSTSPTASVSTSNQSSDLPQSCNPDRRKRKRESRLEYLKRKEKKDSQQMDRLLNLMEEKNRLIKQVLDRLPRNSEKLD